MTEPPPAEAVALLDHAIQAVETLGFEMAQYSDSKDWSHSYDEYAGPVLSDCRAIEDLLEIPTWTVLLHGRNIFAWLEWHDTRWVASKYEQPTYVVIYEGPELT